MFGDYATMHIAAKARVVFMNNSAEYLGGAVSIEDRWDADTITVGVESYIMHIYIQQCPKVNKFNYSCEYKWYGILQ